MRELPHSIDPASFARVVDQCATDQSPMLREQLQRVIGWDGITTLNAVLRPRLLQIQLNTRGDPHDWGAIYRHAKPMEAGALNISDLDRQQLESLTTGLLIMFTSLLAWWSASTDVPVGLEHTWWLVTSVIEIADNSDFDDHQLAEFEARLQAVLNDSNRIAAGRIDEVADELARTDDLVLAERAVATAEDVARLIMPMGSTVLLDEVLHRKRL